MCCIFEVLDHVTKAGFVNQSTQWFQEEREGGREGEREGERVCVSERERERERERETGKGELGGMQQAELHRRYERDFWLTNTTTTLLLSCHWLTPTDQQTVCRAHNFPGLLSLRFKPIFKIFFFLTTQVSWRCVRKRGQTEDMSEHEWEMCECVCFSCLSLPFLSLGFCVCVFLGQHVRRGWVSWGQL